MRTRSDRPGCDRARRGRRRCRARPRRVRAGDVIVGLRSPNLRSNGFSLVRSIVAGRDLDEPLERSSLGEVLLSPSVIYSPAVQRALQTCEVHAAVHVTGGGIPGNLPRALPAELGYELDNWEVPAIFGLVVEVGRRQRRGDGENVQSRSRLLPHLSTERGRVGYRGSSAMRPGSSARSPGSIGPPKETP